MRIGLVDVDNHNKLEDCYPNLVLMKLSAYHKSIGDDVEWHDPYKYYDTVYMSKVFSFTPEYDEPILTRKIVRGGQDGVFIWKTMTAKNTSIIRKTISFQNI